MAKKLTFDTKKKLPNSLAGLLKVTIKDLKRVVADDEDQVNMGIWARRSRVKKMYQCTVCAAGSVMIGTLKLDLKPGQSVEPGDFRGRSADERIESKLWAINELRHGALDEALFDLHGAPNKYFINGQAKLRKANMLYVRMPDFDFWLDGADFFKAAEKLQKKLEKLGV